MKPAAIAIVAHLGNWTISAAVVVAILAVGASLDGPTETDHAAAVAMDLNDAIQQARAATQEQP